MNLHGLSTTDDIIGKLLPVGEGRVGFQDGLVTTAVRRGGILLLEEMNATGQEVWFALHGLLDRIRALVLVEKDNEVVHQHTSCRIYSTFNPAEYPNLYPGTKELSAAYLRRWASVRMGFLDLRMERAILTKRFPQLETDPDLAAMVDAMLEVARVCREILQQQTHTFDFVMSTGVLEAWVRSGPPRGPGGGRPYGLLRPARRAHEVGLQGADPGLRHPLGPGGLGGLERLMAPGGAGARRYQSDASGTASRSS